MKVFIDAVINCQNKRIDFVVLEKNLEHTVKL